MGAFDERMGWELVYQCLAMPGGYVIGMVVVGAFCAGAYLGFVAGSRGD